MLERYGCRWPDNASDLEIEMACVRKGGSWDNGSKGAGLFHHYEAIRRLLWPELKSHRWHTLCLENHLANRFNVLAGPGSSGKTHEAAWTFLVDYLCHPDTTLLMVSSTDIRGLRLRVWGEIVHLWNLAKERYDWLPGHLIDSKLAITTDDLEEDRARDLRKGIIGIPCIQNGKFVGLGKYVGIKAPRMRLIGDEGQFMGAVFLSAFANLNQNPDFRADILGNFTDPLDVLGKAAEPIDGWSAHISPGKTTVWKSRFMGATVVNLIGTDSPNMDVPAGQPAPFPFLTTREKIETIRLTFGEDSIEYRSQCVGDMKTGLLDYRVLSRDLCRQFRALEGVTWRGSPLTRIYALDAAYGGDRCVGGWIEFGLDLDGQTILNIHPPRIIPVRGPGREPEDVIADAVKADCESMGIPPENMFHDATGRGSLGTALARAWSAQTNPVEFGGRATARPVSLDIYILDPVTRARRLKRCDEHYHKFVTELWYSIRYAVEAAQVRNLPEDVMEEMCMRKWVMTNNNLRCLETKDEMKLRTGRSPDLGDWLAIAVEGARRRGFQIKKLASAESESRSYEFLDEYLRQQERLRSAKQLNYTV